MRQRHVLLAILGALGVILYLDRICIGIALPRIQDDLRIAPEHLGWVSLAFSVGYAGFEVPAGHMGDRRGPRGVLTRIVVAWSAFTALTGAVTGLAPPLVVRFLFGAGEAGALPNVSSVISRWFPAKDRASTMGFFLAATQLGGALSPIVVVPIQQRFGWRASFFAFGVVGVLWAIGWYVWFRDSPAQRPGMTERELAEIGPPIARPRRGLPWRIAVRSRTLWALSAQFFCALYAAFFGVFWGPTFLVKARGFTESELRWASLTWITGVAFNFIGGLASDRLSQRIGLARGRRITGGCGLFVVGGGYALAAAAHGKATTVAALMLVAAAWGFAQATSLAVTIDVGRAHAGTVAGVMNTAAQIAGAVSAVVFGYLVKATGGFEPPMYLMAGVAALGATAWLAIDASKPIVPEDEQSSAVR